MNIRKIVKHFCFLSLGSIDLSSRHQSPNNYVTSYKLGEDKPIERLVGTFGIIFSKLPEKSVYDLPHGNQGDRSRIIKYFRNLRTVYSGNLTDLRQRYFLSLHILQPSYQFLNSKFKHRSTSPCILSATSYTNTKYSFHQKQSILSQDLWKATCIKCRCLLATSQITSCNMSLKVLKTFFSIFVVSVFLESAPKYSIAERL